MFDIKSTLSGATDRTRWAARGATFMTKLKATKVVWFPPEPVKAVQNGAVATARTSKTTAKKASGTARKADSSAKKAGSTATKTGSAAVKKATGAARPKKKSAGKTPRKSTGR